MTDILTIALGLAVYELMRCLIYGGWRRDSTDPTGDNSGLLVLTDDATGVQYVASSFGMCARIGRDGRPYREEKDR